MTNLAIIVPCYNEEEALKFTIPKLLELLKNLISKNLISSNSFLLFIDDGSDDNTWKEIILACCKEPIHIKGIRLAINCGHQSALLCGLNFSSENCDAAISIDADLQNGLDAIPLMLDAFKNGAEIVVGVRTSRDTDTVLKRSLSNGFYGAMNLIGVDLVKNHADFRLLSKKALINLKLFPEKNIFLRGLSPKLHKKIEVVQYVCEKRIAGQSKYTYRKMISLALNGITSLTVAPLRLIFLLGLIVFTISLMMIVFILISAANGKALPGWASIILPVYLLGGLIMLSIGILGEYIGKVFIESKNRPRYLIDELSPNTVKEGMTINVE